MAFNLIYDNDIIMHAQFYCSNMGNNGGVTGYFPTYDQMMQAAWGSNYSSVGAVSFHVIFTFSLTPSNQDIVILFKQGSNNFTNYTQTLSSNQLTIACNSIYTSRNYTLQVDYTGTTVTVTKIRPNIGNKKINTIYIGNKPLKSGYIGNKIFYGEITSTTPPTNPPSSYKLKIKARANYTFYDSPIYIYIYTGLTDGESVNLELNGATLEAGEELTFTDSDLPFYIDILIEGVHYPANTSYGDLIWYIKCTDHPGVTVYGTEYNGVGSIGWSGGFNISNAEDVTLDITC